MSIDLTYVQDTLSGAVARVHPLRDRQDLAYDQYRQAYQAVNARDSGHTRAGREKERFYDLFAAYVLDMEEGLDDHDKQFLDAVLFSERLDREEFKAFAEDIDAMDNPFRD